MGAADADHPRGVLRERARQPLTARFAAQLLAGPRARTPVDVCERLLAVQAQDPRGFRLAVRARCRPGLSVRDVEAALDSGELVVSWLNRGTLHLVRRADYWPLHALTTPPLFTGNARRLREEGVSPEDAERGVAAVVGALAGGPASRAALRAAVAGAGVRVEGQAFTHVVMLATLRGLVVRGPMAGREQAYVLAADWLGPPPRAVDRPAALSWLAERYLAGHGPASDRDLARWAGLSLRDARAGLAAIRTADAGEGLVDLPRRGRAPGGAAGPPPVLLGAFDPVLLGWASRAWVTGEHDARVVQGGLFRPFALVGGRAVATWTVDRERVAVAPFAAVEPEALAAEARDVERFLYGT